MPNPDELKILEQFRRGAFPRITAGSPGAGDWMHFSLLAAMHACRLVREHRLTAAQGGSSRKSDGSPVTRLEERIETFVREELARFAPEAAFVAEETGGYLPASGFALALDPIDGTWAFLNGTETCTTTIALYSDGRPIAGIVANPATGEIGYAEAGGRTRLVQLSLFGEEDRAISLPFPRTPSSGRLINLQPSKDDKVLYASLLKEWSEGNFSFLRSPGGSPSWSLLEAAKGEFVYINLWSRRGAQPYDLAPGTLLVRGAGGDVIDLAGNSIDVLRHEGPFVAGLLPEARERVVALLHRLYASDLLPSSPGRRVDV